MAGDDEVSGNAFPSISINADWTKWFADACVGNEALSLTPRWVRVQADNVKKQRSAASPPTFSSATAISFGDRRRSGRSTLNGPSQHRGVPCLPLRRRSTETLA
jgi:hypothetical protein